MKTRILIVVVVLMLATVACQEQVSKPDCSGYTRSLGQTAPIYYDDGAKTETIGHIRWAPSEEMLYVTKTDGAITDQKPLKANSLALVGQRVTEKVVVAVQVCTDDYTMYTKSSQMNEKKWNDLVEQYETSTPPAP